MTISSSYPSKSVNWHKNFLWIIPISILWIYLWFFPWQGIFRSLQWAPVGIGVILFTIPGICVYGLLMKGPAITISHITSGFVISYLLLTLLGTLGRLIHLSFETVKILMVIVGLMLLLKYILMKIPDGFVIFTRQINAKKVLSVLLLLLVAMAACTVVTQRVLTDDDLSYLAYMTNWQNSIHLDFNDVIFGESLLVLPRFWLIGTPFSQALLSDVSHMPGILLLSGYYEPFLVILAVLCWYELARTLNVSPQAASASSILQLVFLLFLSEYLHPGAPFFTQLSADKATAAFIVAPVFFQSLFRSLKEATKSNYYMFIFAGFSLTLMHPVILAYSAFIGGVLVFLNWKKTGIQEKAVHFLIILAIILPQIVLRFANTSMQIEIPYTAQDILNQNGLQNMIKQWGDTQFYGFNPGILDMKIPYGEKIPFFQSILTRGWLIFPLLSAAVALKYAEKNFAAQFLLACFLLGFLAWAPFTGWIIGYFLSAYMLERAVWLFPFGLSVVYPFLILRDTIQEKLHHKLLSIWKRFMSPNRLLMVVTVTAIGLFSLYLHEKNLPDFEKFLDKSQRYQGLSIAGKELDQLISDRAYVIGSPNLNDLIPGISWKSDLITFRISDPSNMSYYTQKEREERISDTQELFLNSTSPEEKMNLLEKHNVRFLFITPFDLRLFDKLIETYPQRVRVNEAGGVMIIQIYR